MDGAANLVNKLVQHVLPARPHHLSTSPTQRYPVVAGFWQNNSRLQYSTYVSGADRGVLLTRPAYEIRDEPEPLTPNPPNHIARTDAKKKILWKDYQQNKHKKLSESPPDTGASPSMDTRPGRTADSSAAKEVDRKESVRAREAEPRSDLGAPGSASLNEDGSRSISSKLPPKPSQSPSTESRKRAADSNQDLRPQKRAKSDSFTKPESARSSQQEIKRNRDAPGSQERQVGSDAKSANSQGPINGRSTRGVHRDVGSAARSPRPISNGIKPHSERSSQTAVRGDEPGTKGQLPPLLSPLRLSLDEGHEAPSRSPRRRSPDSGSGLLKPPAKIQRGEITVSNRQKSPSLVPELLSPTLPAIIEQELARLKKTPSKGDSSQGASQASQSPSSARKARATVDGSESEQKSNPRRLLVTLRYKKSKAKTVQRLLALEPAYKKEALRKERSISVEGTPPPARKRPAPVDAVVDSPSSKRSIASGEKTISARPIPPSTPLKTTAMSRAASSNSQAQTPGDSTGRTPGANDRPATSHGESTGGVKSAPYYHRWERYSKLGTKLKHDRDAIFKPRLTNGASKAEAASQLSTSQKKLVAALSLEMVMSYMIAFKSLNQGRATDRKPSDFRAWEGLLPHLLELRTHTSSFSPLENLACQLRAVCLEQVVTALTTHEATVVGIRLMSVTKQRAEAWANAFRCVETVDENAMRVTLGPWHSVEDAVRTALPVLRRWTDRERVDWDQEITLPPS